VPLALGAKPKQSAARKLQHLASAAPVPSALAASTFQLARRFLAGRPPANPLEAQAFQRMGSLSPELKGLLSCALDSFDALPPADRNRVYDSSLGGGVDAPVSSAALAQALVAEITQHTGQQIFGDPQAAEQERPGQDRFFDPGGEIFESMLRICKVNGLRTISFRPVLAPGDFLPDEMEQHCTSVLVGEEVQLNCEQQVGNCDGHSLPGEICLRVPTVQNGDGITLEGVNFISLDAVVRLTAKAPGTATAEVETHVFGDLDTPLNEEVEGQTRIIQDCRVHDRLTFVVPDDLPPDVYALQIALPNTTGIPIFGEEILSDQQFIRVQPPSTARFEITAEDLRCRVETSPASFGSDEVGLSIIAAALLPDGSTSELQVLKASNGKNGLRFGNVDSGDQFPLNRTLFSLPQQETLAVAMNVMGYEIDSEEAFEKQIEDSMDFFIELLKEQWEFLKDNESIGGALGALIKKFGVKGVIAIAIAAVIVIAIDAIIARWAPADPIMQEALGFSEVDLAELTSLNFPSPGHSSHDATDDITVTLNPLGKLPNQYREFRQYISSDEESQYELVLRYNRTA
jgi:hypothetical protein